MGGGHARKDLAAAGAAAELLRPQSQSPQPAKITVDERVVPMLVKLLKRIDCTDLKSGGGACG